MCVLRGADRELTYRRNDLVLLFFAQLREDWQGQYLAAGALMAWNGVHWTHRGGAP